MVSLAVRMSYASSFAGLHRRRLEEGPRLHAHPRLPPERRRPRAAPPDQDVHALALQPRLQRCVLTSRDSASALVILHLRVDPAVGIEDVAPTAAVSELKSKLLAACYRRCDEFITQVRKGWLIFCCRFTCCNHCSATTLQFNRNQLPLLPGADAEQSLEQVRYTTRNQPNTPVLCSLVRAQVMSAELSRLRSDLGSDSMKVLTHVSIVRRVAA